MILDERLRWMGFWMLDKTKGGKIREYYDQIRYAWKEGSSVEETEKKIQDLIAHAVKNNRFLQRLSGRYFTEGPSGGKQRYVPSAV